MMNSAGSQSFLKSAVGVTTIFVAFTAYLICLVNFHPVSGSESNLSRIELRFPRNLDEARSIAELLNEFKSNHFGYVLVLFCSAYIYKQLFSVPGSVFLNLVGGALFGMPIGVPLCCFLNATGASCCYLLVASCRDSVIRIEYVRKRLNSLVKELNAQLGEQAFEIFPEDAAHDVSSNTAAGSNVVRQDEDDSSTGLRQRIRTEPQQTPKTQQRPSVERSTRKLVVVLTGLRLLPLCPQWLINLASPIIGVPLRVFFVSAFIGLLPYNFLCVQAGSVLRELRSLDSLFQPKMVLQLALVAATCLFAPVLFRKLRARFTNSRTAAAPN